MPIITNWAGRTKPVTTIWWRPRFEETDDLLDVAWLNIQDVNWDDITAIFLWGSWKLTPIITTPWTTTRP